MGPEKNKIFLHNEYPQTSAEQDKGGSQRPSYWPRWHREPTFSQSEVPEHRNDHRKRGPPQARTSSSEDLLKRITARPDVFNGKPIIRDMRISVELVLSLLSQGASHEELMDDYPDLEEEDIRACIAYAHAVIAGDSLAQVSVG